jgi:hypothetical protein
MHRSSYVPLGRGMQHNNICAEQESSQDIGDKTPKEAFTGVKPEIGHFKIFGCPIYIHVLV